MGPHYGLRIKSRADIKSMTVLEIVRPEPIEIVVGKFKKLGLVEEKEEENTDISWAEAKKLTRRTREKGFGNTQPEVKEYDDDTGITESMAKATWQYAQWSAATELRLLFAKGVKVKRMSQNQIEENCGRGLPWRVKQQPIGSKKHERYIK